MPDNQPVSDKNDELRELCREVYEVTKWEPKSLDTKYFIERDERGEQIPLYTSDYLLDRIVKGGGVIRSATLRKKSQRFIAHGGRQREYADTPLKALLKLVLALADANELPTNDKGGE